MDEDKDMRGMDYNSYKDLQNKHMNIIDIVQQHEQESDELINNMGLNLSFESQ